MIEGGYCLVAFQVPEPVKIPNPPVPLQVPPGKALPLWLDSWSRRTYLSGDVQALGDVDQVIADLLQVGH